MGMFSWICSDTDKELLIWDIDLRNPNFETKTAYCLIPKEFGGGAYIVDGNYQGYGVFYDENGEEHDIYDECGKWNCGDSGDKEKNRYNAINLTYNDKHNLKYPIKIVENLCDYEDADSSLDDPEQGWGGYMEGVWDSEYLEDMEWEEDCEEDI